MDNKDDVYSHVKATIQKIRERGDKPTPSLVVAEAKKQKQRVLKIYAQIMGQEEQERRNREANAICHDVGAAILKDREGNAMQLTASLNETIERLNDTCELLDDEISDLQSTKEGLEQQLFSERESHVEKATSLGQVNAQLNGTIQSMSEQAAIQKSQIEAVEKQRDEATHKHLVSCEILAQKGEELKSARFKADSFSQQLNEVKSERELAVAARNNAEKASERLEGKISELTAQLGKLREDMAEELRLRIEACTASAVASARLEDAGRASTQQPVQGPETQSTPTEAASTKKKPGKEAVSTK